MIVSVFASRLAIVLYPLIVACSLVLLPRLPFSLTVIDYGRGPVGFWDSRRSVGAVCRPYCEICPEIQRVDYPKLWARASCLRSSSFGFDDWDLVDLPMAYPT